MIKLIISLNKHQIITGIILLVFIQGNSAQGDFYADKVYRENIKTVQLHRTGWDLSYPIIELNTPDRLSLSFDDLTNQVKNYTWTIEHCNADWYPSGLAVEEYMSGFAQQPIQDYALSFNTYVNYVHYKINLPNDDVQIKLSGNYVIKVLEDYDESNPVLVRRFSVSESLASITGRASRPVSDPYRDDGQQVNFSVRLGSLSVDDPYSEIKVAIQQNNRWNMSIRELKPLFVRGDELDYNHTSENIFKAGNEYRYIDIKSMRYMAEMVKEIDYQPPHYHVFLYPDPTRDNGRYFYREDLNGRYYIEVQEGVNRETESDYVHVHFTLPMDVPFVHGKLYISGALNNWEFNDINKMEYNFGTKAYELDLLLKQGYYNYEYVFMRDDSLFPDAAFLEGSYYETENDYLVYVYLSTNTSRYDRLIAYQVLNSLRQN
ncbi:DUF5103 domain-containing protein [Bacteroidota bacterium]